MQDVQVVQSFTIDGRTADLSTFVLPEMSLSLARSQMTAHYFLIGFGVVALADLFSPVYDKLKAELKEDDALIGKPGSILAVAGYPCLEHVLCVPELAHEILDLLLAEALQDRSWSGLGSRRYWFDRSLKCRVKGDAIEIIGLCYSAC